MQQLTKRRPVAMFPIPTSPQPRNPPVPERVNLVPRRKSSLVGSLAAFRSANSVAMKRIVGFGTGVQRSQKKWIRRRKTIRQRRTLRRGRRRRLGKSLLLPVGSSTSAIPPVSTPC